MKKFALLFGLVFAFQAALIAQPEDQENVVFNAHLWSTFELVIVSGDEQEITFLTAADYNNGVDESAGIVPGFTEITIEATENWNLTIQALDDFQPYVGGPIGAGTGFIPIGNLGVWISEDGDHGIGTGEVTYTCTAPASIQPLTLADDPLISLGSNPNSGDASDNAFTLHWEMGTVNVGFGQTIFEQMAAGDFTTGDYTTTATLSLWQD